MTLGDFLRELLRTDEKFRDAFFKYKEAPLPTEKAEDISAKGEGVDGDFRDDPDEDAEKNDG